MQTFLTNPSFEVTAKSLHRLHLGKQRVEVLQLLNVLHETRPDARGYRNHPALRMWRGFEMHLAVYGLAMCDEWAARGYANTKTRPQLEHHLDLATCSEYPMEPPWWTRDPDFHLRHQSNLVRKMPEHYGPQFPGVPDDLPYTWPEAQRV